MKLLAKALIKQMPTLDESASLKIEEQFAYVKIFNPMGSQTWYLTSYSEDEHLAFGFVNLGDPQMAELGYISMQELEEIRLPFGLKLERDLGFDKMPLQELINKVKKGEHI